MASTLKYAEIGNLCNSFHFSTTHGKTWIWLATRVGASMCHLQWSIRKGRHCSLSLCRGMCMEVSKGGFCFSVRVMHAMHGFGVVKSP